MESLRCLCFLWVQKLGNGASTARTVGSIGEILRQGKTVNWWGLDVGINALIKGIGQTKIELYTFLY